MAQLLQISSLASLRLIDCPKIGKTTVRELAARLWTRHGRHLSVIFWKHCR
jgi:hypothetical protein